MSIGPGGIIPCGSIPCGIEGCGFIGWAVCSLGGVGSCCMGTGVEGLGSGLVWDAGGPSDGASPGGVWGGSVAWEGFGSGFSPPSTAGVLSGGADVVLLLGSRLVARGEGGARLQCTWVAWEEGGAQIHCSLVPRGPGPLLESRRPWLRLVERLR